MSRPEKQSSSSIVSFTFGEVALIPGVLEDIADGTVTLGSNWFSKRYNRGRARFIKEEMQHLVVFVEDEMRKDELEVLTVETEVEMRRGTRGFLLNAVRMAIHHRETTQPENLYYDIVPGALSEEINVLRGLAATLETKV